MASKREKIYESIENSIEKDRLNVLRRSVGDGKNSEAAKAAFRVGLKVARIGKLTPLEKKLVVALENTLNTRYKDFVKEFQDWDVAEYVIIQASKDCPGITFSFSEKSQTFKVNL